MVSGNPNLRSPPYTSESVLDTAQGVIQPVQWTCPRSDESTPLYPTNSDGLHGVGIQDPQNGGAGVGFPDKSCDGYASPLRADIHFPSCYNPAAGPDDYKNNMVFPSSKGATNGANCPAGWIHTPHVFFEVYWNALLFSDLWTPGQGTQPFVLAQGDPTGYGLHGDFLAGWEPGVLQQIIDNCDTGNNGVDTCPGLQGGLNDKSTNCNIPIPTPAGAAPEQVTGLLAKLPGNNPVVGWGGTVAVAGAAPTTSSPAVPVSTSKAAATTSSTKAAVPTTTSAKVAAASTTSTSSKAAATSSPVSSKAATSTTSSAAASTTSGFTSIGCYSDSSVRSVCL